LLIKLKNYNGDDSYQRVFMKCNDFSDILRFSSMSRPANEGVIVCCSSLKDDEEGIVRIDGTLRW
jgi:hypothetical protein